MILNWDYWFGVFELDIAAEEVIDTRMEVVEEGSRDKLSVEGYMRVVDKGVRPHIGIGGIHKVVVVQSF